MEKINVGAISISRNCNVRYNGVVLPFTHEALARWRREGRLVSFCPEVAGGLPVPRPAAEIVFSFAEGLLILVRRRSPDRGA
jgi:uncharacterized protein YbbK (DUF523 family)